MIHLYEKSDLPISPFIVAPLPKHQDTVIFGERFLYDLDKDFINSLYSNESISKTEFPFVALTTLQNNYLVYVRFYSANAIEIDSQRKGLSLSIGMLFSKSTEKELLLPIKRYLLNFIHIFNNVFKIDLYNNGSEDFLNQLQQITAEDSNTIEINFKHNFIKCMVDLETAYKEMTLSKSSVYNFFNRIKNKLYKTKEYNIVILDDTISKDIIVDNELEIIMEMLKAGSEIGSVGNCQNSMVRFYPIDLNQIAVKSRKNPYIQRLLVK